MKKEKNQLLRLQTMIEKDRISLGDNFLHLVENDVNKVLRDYFDFIEPAEIRLDRENEGYYLSFSLKVSRIKHFANISKENIENY